MVQCTDVGICLKPVHYAEILQTLPEVSFLEVHSENYMGRGGPSLAYLQEVRKHYPISMHGVSLSLGSDEDLNREHLSRLQELAELIDPIFISEHLSWSRIGNTYLNDLLPLPYTPQTLTVVVEHVSETQDILDREIFIENPSTYMSFKESTIDEPDFLNQLTERTGCKLLLDVNNIYVSANNNAFDTHKYIDAIRIDSVGQIHLAGHACKSIGDATLRIDDHGSKVCEDVWDLFKYTILKLGCTPTLIEWDTNIPSLPALLEEAGKAQAIIDNSCGAASAQTG